MASEGIGGGYAVENTAITDAEGHLFSFYDFNC